MTTAKKYNSEIINGFKDFVKANQEKINRITPFNPSIDSDKEWMKEDIWDDLYSKGN